MRYIVAVLFFNSVCLSSAQDGSQNSKIIPIANLKEDLRVLKLNLETVHPGLFEYLDPVEFDSIFSQLNKSISSPISDIDFYRLLAPLQSKIQNGHTMIIPSENWSKTKDTEKALFPFEVYIDDGQLFISKNLSSEQRLVPGTEIRSINKEPVERVIEELIASITQDGKNKTYPLHLLQVGFSDWYADIKGTPAVFELELAKDNQTYALSIAGLTLDKINANHLERYGQKKTPWYLKEDERQLSLTTSGDVATLVVPTFDSSVKSVDGKNFKRFYKDAFSQIAAANIQNVILDLRGNGGGDPMPQLALLTHLIDLPLTLYKRTYAVTQKIPNPEFYENDKIGWMNLLLKMALREQNNVYIEDGGLLARLKGAPPKKPTPPSKNFYKGNLYVLTNGGSFSATGEVAGILKDHNRGIFVGEETGGSDYQNSSGIMIMLYLPHSQIRINLPLLCFELNVKGKNDGYGTMPDYTVRPSIVEFLSGKDVVLAHTLSLIENDKE